MREYRMTDLVDATGASFSQIMTWRRRGLLPRAVLKGQYSYWTEQHVTLIRLIQDKYAGNMTAADIRDCTDLVAILGPPAEAP